MRSSSLVIHAAGTGVLSQRVSHELGEIGLNLIDALILYVALRNEMVRMELLPAALGRPRTTIAHSVARLEGLGYLQRRRNTFDRRRVDVALTRLGRTAAQIADALLEELEGEVDGIGVGIGNRAAVMAFSRNLQSLPVGTPLSGD